MTPKVFNLKKERKNYLQMAKELCYNEATLEKIENATSEYDLSRAMRYGRETTRRTIYDCTCRV